MKYKPLSTKNLKSLAKTEHNETKFQSQDPNLQTHPAIHSALEHFADNPKAFEAAVLGSKIETIKKGAKLTNTDFGKGTSKIEPKKQARVEKMLKSGSVDRPGIIRYTNLSGQQFNHVLWGNTRLTNIGPGAQAHVLEVGNK